MKKKGPAAGGETLNYMYVYIYRSSDNFEIETISISSATFNNTPLVIINPVSDLAYSTEYYILIDTTAIKNTTNNYYAGITDPLQLRFTTEIDTIAPVLLSSIPAHNATNVVVNSPIELTFHETVVAGVGVILIINATTPAHCSYLSQA